MTAVGIVAFVVVLLVSVMIHEAGHFLTARRYGMKATEFFVGFGPRLWSVRRGETEYGVKAIPAGGYVKIVGMTDLEDVAPEDQPRAFYRQPAGRRAVVLAAGGITHFVLGFLMLVLVPMTLGLPERTATVRTVSACVPSDPAAPCAPDDPPSPASQVQLQPGDRIVSVDGHRISSWDDATAAIRAAGPGQTAVVVERDGRQVTLMPTLVEVTRPGTDDAPASRVPFLGFTPRVESVRSGPIDAILMGSEMWVTAVSGSVKALGALPAAVPDLLRQTFGGEERSADGLVGPVGIGRVSGDLLSASQVPLSGRVANFLLTMAGLNVFLGIFNLLPLLPLDGGHLAVLGFEEARRGVYRWKGRPDPGRVDLTRLLPAAYVFLAVLIGLSLMLLAADIVNPITL